MKTTSIIAASVSALLLGSLIWAFSPTVFGTVEPWDSKNILPYLVTLFATGFITSLIAGPKNKHLFWLWPILTAAGQLLYCLIFLKVGALIFIGLFFIAILSILSLFGSSLALILELKEVEHC